MPIIDKIRKMIRDKGGSVAGVTTIESGIKELGNLASNPLTGLIVDATIAPDEDLLGKVVGDLQSDVIVLGTKITGTLNWVTGYTGFSGDEEMQSGNYVALYMRVPEIDDAVITVESEYGRQATLDDGLFIRRIQNGDTDEKWVKVTASKEGYPSVTRYYSFMDLTLIPEE